MCYREKSIEKIYFSIGEVARQFNVTTTLLRYWETVFEQLCPKKTKRGERFYSGADIETVREIYHLVKHRRFTLEGARMEMENKI